MMDEQAIVCAYESLNEARANLHFAVESALMLKRDYETAKADGLLSGEITGKNELERDAAARKTYSIRYYAMVSADGMERQARYEFDRELSRVEMTRALLRLAELEARTTVTGKDGGPIVFHWNGES